VNNWLGLVINEGKYPFNCGANFGAKCLVSAVARYPTQLVTDGLKLATLSLKALKAFGAKVSALVKRIFAFINH
jgi:hypothetical protein